MDPAIKLGSAHRRVHKKEERIFGPFITIKSGERAKPPAITARAVSRSHSPKSILKRENFKRPGHERKGWEKIRS